MLIRNFEPADADALAALFHTSVHQVGIQDYSSEQVAAWSPSKPDVERYSKLSEGTTFLVAVDDSGKIAGYGVLEGNGHIDHLYCRPDVVGTGVGSAILGSVEQFAREAGIADLFAEASEGARRLFERRGFKLEARNDFTINGVAIHNYRMSKSIAQTVRASVASSNGPST
ncbi:GNAT family N-acetyltransferase [Stenotrophomonas geniculata]|uniref:GNAT family N-acetyltransferase n=1 Tax=Stenotrophomonas geniculata TaxID=86188 RepID=UPI000C1BC73F|nr:GNAT family N-acetyltransferase [Stenotrophomonas geniculata]WNF09035.1 GNAT family N-acetyltransferase [Stenotrophomonas geniculata]